MMAVMHERETGDGGGDGGTQGVQVPAVPDS
jgi:hypothetical protein